MADVLDSYFYDFKFGDKYLSDFGGTIINADGWQLKNGVTTTKLTEKIPNRHGELFLGYTYNPRIIPVSVYIEEDIDIDEFYAWLLDGQNVFSFVDSGKEINVILDNEIDIRAFYDNGFKGTLDLSFIAYDPFWRVTNEKHIISNNVVLNTPITVKNKGNIESYPLIMVTPYGTQSKIRFKWNDNIIILQNISKPIYIDCEHEECYEMNLGQKVIVSSKYYSDEYYTYPEIKPYKKNIFELIEGNITSLDINPNSIFI